MKRDRDEDEKNENSERWLLTYSDMITLLLVLFIMMYTISKVDTAKFSALAEQLGITLGTGTAVVEGSAGGANINEDLLLPSETPKSTSSETPESTTKASDQAELGIEQQLQQLTESTGLGSMVSIHTEKRGVIVSLQEALFFSSGSAKVNENAKEMLKKLAGIINSVENIISVEGSTDNVPIENAHFDSNWELASSRAINVVKLLVGFGVDPVRISATSYGEYRPVAANDTEQNKELNRRVDIVFIDEQLNAYQPGYENDK